MANVSKISGLTPVSYLNGADWNGQARNYYVPSSNTDILSLGDPVKLAGDADTAGVPSVSRATASATAVGVIVGIGKQLGGPYIDFNDLTKVGAPSVKTAAYYLLVADDPNIVYEIQEDGIGGVMASADVGLNVDFIAADPASGSLVSGFLLDSSTKAATSTLNLKILGLSRSVDNAYGASAKWLVLLNNHSFRTGIAGI